MKTLTISILALLLSSCAYNFGYQDRRLPEGYKQISVPVFENKTNEVGAEVYFTNALVQEFERSRVARVTDRNTAPVVVKGIIEKIRIDQNQQVAANSKEKDLVFLPKNTVINTGYRMRVTTKINIERKSDKKVIWTQKFNNEVVFNPAQVSLPGLNTANPLYNYSVKHENMAVLADQMMKEAHDRMTERF